MLRHRLGTLNRTHRLTHILERDGISTIAQPAQQAALKPAPVRQHVLTHVSRKVSHLPLWRARRQIGEKQIRLGDAFGATCLHDAPIGREQPHWLMRRTFNHIIEIFDHGLERGEQYLSFGGIEHHFPAFHHAEQALTLFGEPGDAVEADDFERAMRLMQMRLAKLDLGGFRRISQIGRHRRAGLAQGLLDFPFDPGQGTDIKFRCGTHCHATLKPDTDDLSS